MIPTQKLYFLGKFRLILANFELSLSYHPRLSGERDRKLMIFAKYQYEDDGVTIKSLPGYTDVTSFFVRLLGKAATMTDTWKVPPDVIEKVIGKKIVVLEYCAGTYRKPEEGAKDNLSYNTWSKFKGLKPGVGDEESIREELVAEFYSSLERGFPKDYTPDTFEKFRLKGDNSCGFHIRHL